MKRNKVFTLLVSALVLLASCNSNDDITTVSTQPSQEANFLGKTAIAFAKSINETNATRATTTYSVKSINALPVRQDLPVTRSAAELPDFYTVTLNNKIGRASCRERV